MGLTMKERKAVIKEVAKRYRKSSKKVRGQILNEFVALTGYNRSYANYVLRNCGKRVLLKAKGKTVVVILGEGKTKAKRQREKIYDHKVLRVLKSIWLISDYLCGKRLAPFLKEVVPILERFGEIQIDKDTREKFMHISPATIDRLLAPERKRQALKGRARTKPGTLLKHQIPIRTFSEWDDLRPGFVEVDLVGHEGGDASGEFAYTLDLTDVCTGWTETEAVRNRAQKWVFEALINIEGKLPFKLLGLDSDNDSAFINAHFLRYCNERQITFTRTRPQRKNDNCFVEQKNYSIVRRAVGYSRYDTEEELKIINELYGHLRLYTNFFQPVMKLIEKTRTGSKVTKKYDKPRTPYQRVLESPLVFEENKEKLRQQYDKLNPAELKRSITRLQNRLTKLATMKRANRCVESLVSNVRFSGDSKVLVGLRKSIVGQI